jgi:DNA-binding GntR family transcriptional regulator
MSTAKTKSLAAQPPLIRRHSLHDTVADRLRDMIADGTLPAGERIHEQTLCEAFGISRTPLREALKVLANEGLVELRANRGSRVAALTAAEMADLFEALWGVERHAAELAAAKATTDELAMLRALHDRMEREWRRGRRTAYAKLNNQIHRTIVELARNATLLGIHTTIMTKLRRARYMALMSNDRWDEAVREHRTILAALEARDSLEAGRCLAEHVRRTGEVVCGELDT